MESFAMKSKRQFRWLPRHGEPLCLLEFLSQQFVRWIAYLPAYIAVVTTITLVVIIWGAR